LVISSFLLTLLVFNLTTHIHGVEKFHDVVVFVSDKNGKWEDGWRTMDTSVTPKGHWYVFTCHYGVELSGMFPFLVSIPFPSSTVLLNESPMTSQSMQLTSNIDQVTHFRFVIMALCFPTPTDGLAM
jgi:hypothetical protein